MTSRVHAFHPDLVDETKFRATVEGLGYGPVVGHLTTVAIADQLDGVIVRYSQGT